MDKLLEIQRKYNRYEDALDNDTMDIEIPMAAADTVPHLVKMVKTYEKALEEITRQHENTSVNRAREIALGALGDLTEERKRTIQSY